MTQPTREPAPVDPSALPRGWVNRTVAGAGLTSALGDFCYETTTVILPGLLAVLGIPAALLAFWFGADSLVLLAGIFCFAGLYVAVQEALEATVTADMVEPETLTMSIGALGTVNGTAKFVSSATVGAVWTALSPAAAFLLAAGFMLAGTLMTAQVRDRWTA